MRVTLAAFLVASGALCQMLPPAFEVASIRPSDGHLGIDMKTYPSRLSATAVSVHQLIEAAYSLERWQVTSGPAWLETDRFDIEAKTSEGLSAESDRVSTLGRPAPRRMMLMLQTLLAERFNLKVHRETRQDNVFTLVVAKGGPKLQAPKDTTRSYVGSGRRGFPQAIAYTMEGVNASMEQLVHALEGQMRRPVTDRTGLPGKYDFRFEYGDDSTTGDSPAFLTAFQDATGLKLNTAKGPVEFLVVDHADKPSAN
jgi:uncharacterized protein (TIGR03435 family)